MRRKAALLAVVGVTVLGLLALNVVEADTRRAKPGDTKRPSVVLKNGGADCASATLVPEVDPIDYSDNGNTCGAPAVVSDYASGPCDSLAYPGPEVIYRMEVGAVNDITVTLSPVNPADLGVFIVSDCANTTSCVGFQDAEGSGLVSAVTFSPTGTTPCAETFPSDCPTIPEGSYWIYVDSFYAAGPASCGDYQLQVQGSLPVELMEFSVE